MPPEVTSTRAYDVFALLSWLDLSPIGKAITDITPVTRDPVVASDVGILFQEFRVKIGSFRRYFIKGGLAERVCNTAIFSELRRLKASEAVFIRRVIDIV